MKRGRIEPIDLTNPTNLLNWLTLIRGHAMQAIEAAEDLLRKPSKRRFTDAKAREAIRLGKRNFLRIYRAAWAAIPAGTPLQNHDPDRDPPSTDPTRDE